MSDPLIGLATADTDTSTLIAELQRRERQLRESQQIARIGSWEWDLSSDRIEWSEELFRLWGLDPGTPFSYDEYVSRLHPDDRARMKDVIARAIEERGSYTVEHRITLPDGQQRWIHGRGQVVTGADGRAVALHGTAQDITDRVESEQRERRRFEEQLAHERARHERERLHQLLNAAPAMIAVLRGPTHIFEFVNDRFREAAGNLTLIGRPIRDALPTGQPELLDLLDEVYATGERRIGHEVASAVDRDGDGIPESQGYFDFIYEPLRDERGLVDGIMIHAVEVTAQVAARGRERERALALERSEAHLRLAMEAGRMGSWEWDVAAARVVWSPALEMIHGLEPGTFGGTFDDYQRDIHPDDRERVFAQIEATMQQRKAHHLEYRIVLPDGRVRWLEARGRLFTNEAGEPIRLVGICMDVTDRKQAETALVDRTRLASLSADVATALTAIVLDKPRMLQRCAQAVVDRLDAAFARVWTFNQADQVLVLQASAGLYTHVDGGHARIPLGQFKIGRIAENRRPHLTNDVAHDPEIGDPEWARREGMVAFAGYPLLIGDELVGVLAMFARHRLSDADFEALASVASGVSLGVSRIRARRALEESEARHRRRAEELSRLATALERTNRELDAFAYAASHDLRAPLRGIANLAQWIEEDVKDALPEDSRQMLALMRSRMHRMEALIDGILQYSRAGRTHEPPVDVPVGDLVAEVVDLLSPEDAEIVAAPDLPVVFTEKLPLQQVFQNLIGNAVKHGGPGVEVEISAVDRGDFWEFQVSDNGPGIAPEFHERIWGIFQTLQPRDEVEGAGIGLSLVKKLTEAQGGRVTVQSAPGEGATFSVWWPKRAATEGA